MGEMLECWISVGSFTVLSTELKEYGSSTPEFDNRSSNEERLTKRIG